MSGNRFSAGGAGWAMLGLMVFLCVPLPGAAHGQRKTADAPASSTPLADESVTDEAASPSEPSEITSPSDTPGPPSELMEPAEDDGAGESESSAVPRAEYKRQMLLASLTIFALAMFVGFEVITKVPPTLHTPLMSGSNAISGITIVGALIVAGHGSGWFTPLLGFVAVVLATINVVGGFLVTHRMLAMFKKR